MLKFLQQIFFLVAVTVLLTITAGCNSARQSSSAAEPAGAYTADGKASILFFLDPNEQSCQRQKTILDNARLQIEKHATVRFVQNTSNKDLLTFYRYRVKYLPSIILIDADGNELQRLPTGVQGSYRILTALRNLKTSGDDSAVPFTISTHLMP